VYGVSAEDVRKYLARTVSGARSVLAGSNVSHDSLRELGDMYFLGVPKTPSDAAHASLPAAKWHGGLVRVDAPGVKKGYAKGGRVSVGLPVAATPAGEAVGRVVQALIGATNAKGLGKAEQLADRLAAVATGASARFDFFPASGVALLAVDAKLAYSTEAAVSKAVAGLARLLREVANGQFDDKSFLRARAHAAVQAAADLDARSNELSQRAQALARGLPAPSAAQAAQAILAVSKQDVQNAVQAALKADPALAVVGSPFAATRYDALQALFRN
jgi:predicted Zn-dependent peptidase